MAFTTWSALKTQILDDLANGSVLSSSYSMGGITHSFRSLKEVQDFISFVDSQIASETASSGGAFTVARLRRV